MIEQPKIPSNQTVLVTGASGFVGAHLCVSLARDGYLVVAATNENTPADEVLAVVRKQIKCDLTDAQSIKTSFSEIKPSAVIHAAAYARSALCEKTPAIARAANVVGTQNLIDYVKEFSPSIPFLYISTDLVFDDSPPPRVGFSELDEPKSFSVYGQTKLEGERVVCNAGLSNWFILRLSLVYGRKIGGSEGFLSWLRGGLVRNEPVGLYEDEWRTPVYVDDVGLLVDRILALRNLGNKEDKHSGIFHISGSERINRFDFGLRFAETFGYDKTLLQRQSQHSSALTRRPGDVSLCHDKIVDLFGIKPRDVKTGLLALKDAGRQQLSILRG